MYRTPHAVYCDRGQHFISEVLKEFLKGQAVAIDYSPSGSSKSTGMVEVSNRLLEDVTRKDSSGVGWDRRLPASAKAVNGRHIDYLGMSPSAILFGPVRETSVSTATLLGLPGRSIRKWHDEMIRCISHKDYPTSYLENFMTNPLSHALHVHTYLTHRADLHDKVRESTRIQKEKEARKYDRGVRQVHHNIGDQVMLYQKSTGKLEPRWRGSFKISGHGGGHEISFTLQRADGSDLPGSFHGNHLKTFKQRIGYLRGNTPSLIPHQLLRHCRRG